MRQRPAIGADDAVPAATRGRLDAMRSRGAQLPATVRAPYERHLGHDFAGVRVHTDQAAASLAASVRARAFTVGDEIVFGPAEYQPGTAAGNRVLRHELTHVAQQRLGLGGPAQALETQASAVENGAVPRGLGATPGAHAPRTRLQRLVDQHADTHLPTATELHDIDIEINTTASAAASQWDGDESQPLWWEKRAALNTELTTALQHHLDGVVPKMKVREKDLRLPMTSYEGPGRAAKGAVDGEFGGFASAAALTAPQRHARDTFAFTAGKQLLDRTDPAAHTPGPADLTSWIAETDKQAAAVQKNHNFNKNRSTKEAAWLFTLVIAPFAHMHLPELKLYDRYGFASAQGGIVSIAPTAPDQPEFPVAKPSGGGPSPAERRVWWNMWQTLVHEYIHTLEHPTFENARGENRVFTEGFCEMFTEDVLTIWIPIAKADSDTSLRKDVEGSDSTGALWPDFKPEFVHDYNAGLYTSYAGHAKQVRTVLGTGGGNAVRAAFFQGHVELIGLASAGKVAAAPTGPAAAKGMRFHTVVASGPTVETSDQIAAQNGVTVPDLEKANPGVDFAKLKTGDVVLIPVP